MRNRRKLGTLALVVVIACATGEDRETVKLPLPRPPAPASVDPAAPTDSATSSDPRRPSLPVGASDSVSMQIPIPRIVKNFCPGEDCGYSYDMIVCRDLVLHSTDSIGAPEVGRAFARDTINVETGNLHILEPGKVFLSRDYAATDMVDEDGQPIGARKDTARFAARDTLYLFEREFPGIVTWWYHGKLGHDVAFWDETTPTGRVQKRGSGAVQVSRGNFVWWYRVTTPAGVEGWWMQEGMAAVGVGPLAYKCDFKKGDADTAAK